VCSSCATNDPRISRTPVCGILPDGLLQVLCPVDFSPHADHALAIAATTPGIGEIILLHVVSRNESGDETAEIADQAQIRLADLRHNLAEQNIRARTIVRAGALLPLLWMLPKNRMHLSSG
jgi:hypothetical protein